MTSQTSKLSDSDLLYLGRDLGTHHLPANPDYSGEKKWEPLRKEEAAGSKSPHIKEQGTETT